MTVQTTRVSLPCLRCDGDGEIPRYYHYAHGRCFRCDGSGLDPRAGRTVAIHNGDVDAQDAIDRAIYKSPCLWRHRPSLLGGIMKELITRYYLWLASLPVIGGAIHFIIHTTTHLLGIHGCP